MVSSDVALIFQMCNTAAQMALCFQSKRRTFLHLPIPPSSCSFRLKMLMVTWSQAKHAASHPLEYRQKQHGMVERLIWGGQECSTVNLALTSLSLNFLLLTLGFPGPSVVKNPSANAGGMGSNPGSGRPLGEGKGNPLQYSGLENPADRGAWQATVQGVTKELCTT